MLSLAAGAVLISAPIAGGQEAAPTVPPQTAPGFAAKAVGPPARVVGAYLYIELIPTAIGKHTVPTRYVTLVYRTDVQLPRRSDGSITTGGASIGSQGLGSVGSVHGRASRCYQANTRILPDNTIGGGLPGNRRSRIKAHPGSRLTVRITTESHGTAVERTLTLRAARPGDASGKPLGC
jgi:hypothetical protein